jgi:TPR repeat protein
MFRKISGLSIGLLCALMPFGLQASPLAVEFLPPNIAERDLCNAPVAREAEIHTEHGPGDLDLTDELRLDFLIRDINRLQRQDADRWFDFIDALITRRAQLDETFAGASEEFSRVVLHLKARRLDDLRERNLIGQLRLRADEMSNNQRLKLARYYRDGILVPADLPFAQEMLREAAYGGNARALTEIARMQIRGEMLEGWDAPLDLTVTLAFGGLLGELTPSVCSRAERIAQEYLKGDLVVANPDIAYAWRKFAADMGGVEAAWRVVEYHLNADADRKDLEEMRIYLRRAVKLGLSPDDRITSQLLASGIITEQEIEEILGFNLSQDRRRVQNSIIPYFDLGVRKNDVVVNKDSLRLQYLRELSIMPEAPGFVFADLAKEVIARKGRWAGEAEAMKLLEVAVDRRDETGMQMLAGLLIRYRDDPVRINRAENLLLDTVSRFGMASSMRRLEGLYRCQVNDAPRKGPADLWARNYAATGHVAAQMSANDIVTLSPFRSPEILAKIQTQALQGRTQARAELAQLMQSSPLTSEAALRLWAKRISPSDKALETFVRMEMELARTPTERALAIEFFRRVYLNNGVTSALDLSVALLEDQAREPEVAKDIIKMLTIAGNRGEGASIRLKSRLLAKSTSPEDYAASAAKIYDEFKDVIEERGDFLGLMFAIPFLPESRVDDYFDRAASLMGCENKDADEMGDAYALRQDQQMVYHWRNVVLDFDGGHLLSKLKLTDNQVDLFDAGSAPNVRQVVARNLTEGEPNADMRLYRLTGNPDLPGFDARAAAGHLMSVLNVARDEELIWVMSSYRSAHEDVRALVDQRRDMTAVLRNAANAGDNRTRFEYAMYLRDNAKTPDDLSQSTQWLKKAAEGGYDDAMVELGFALGFGLGTQSNKSAALDWLARAEKLGHPRAAGLAQLIGAFYGK